MMRILFIALMLLAGAARAGGEPGQFDYWVLSLSWSPQYCSSHETEVQCLRPYDFVVHGLWPQYESGYPDNCRRVARPDRGLIERMLPLMPSEKLVINEWRKHGSCSGLDAEDYFLTVERARRLVAIPPQYIDPDKAIVTSPAELEGEFIRQNPGLAPPRIALQCSSRYLREVRICFDKDFRFRDCGAEVRDECRDEIVMRPNRLAAPRRTTRD